MANGGVIGPVGLNMVALAARKHAVPFVVVTGTHKVWWYDKTLFIYWKNVSHTDILLHNILYYKIAISIWLL